MNWTKSDCTNLAFRHIDLFFEVNYSHNMASGDLLNLPEYPFEEIYTNLTIYIGLETRL